MAKLDPTMLQDRDEAVERVLAIDVIHLLAAEGAHSDGVSEQLSRSEVWQAFSQQRHDLFLPASANPQVGFRLVLLLAIRIHCLDRACDASSAQAAA